MSRSRRPDRRPAPAPAGSARGSRALGAEAQPATVPASAPRVLLAEDDPALARLMTQHLSRQGMRVASAADSAAALARLRRERFDIVAIDFELPQMQGLELLRALAGLSPRPAAIVVSGTSELQTAITALRLGAADFVVKADDGGYLELLPATIERVLEKERLRSEKRAAEEALAAQTQLLDLTLRSINQGISVFGPDRKLLAWNSHWLALFGYPPELARVGRPYAEFVAFRVGNDAGCNDEPEIAAKVARVQAGAVERFEYTRANGQVLEVYVNPMPGGGFASIYTDISERKQIEREQKLAAAVFQTSAEAMLITTREGRILRVNPAFERLFGYSAAELVGENPRVLASGNHDTGFYEQFWQAITCQGHWRGGMWNRHKNGQLIVQRVTVSAVRDAAGAISHFVAIFSDITEDTRREAEVTRRAYHDALTGLPNRSLLLDRLAQAVAAAEREQQLLAVLFLDLDGFKAVNDRHGHRAGDLLLQQVAVRLQERCRGSDTVARLGGDEFVILLRNVADREAVEALARKLAGAIQQPFEVEGVTHRIGTSVGIALYPEHATGPEALIRAADSAMYRVKRAGKGEVGFFQAG